MTREQWKQDRKKGIGGSDISAILGLNPYKTAYDVWLDKTGRDIEEPDNENIVAGHILEDAVAKMAEHKYNISVMDESSGDELYIHPDHEIIRGTPDRFYTDHSKPHGFGGIMEIKTTQKKIQSAEDIPKMWITQLVYYLGLIKAHSKTEEELYGCIGYIHSGRFLAFNAEFYEYNEKMQNLFDYMVEQALDFWEKYVVTDTPPPVQTSEDIVRLFGEPEKKMKEATDELLSDYSELKELKQQKKQLEEKISEYEESIKMFIGGEHEGVVLNGEKIATWSFTKPRESFDKKSLKTEHPDIYKKFAKEGKPSRRFLLK